MPDSSTSSYSNSNSTAYFRELSPRLGTCKAPPVELTKLTECTVLYCAVLCCPIHEAGPELHCEPHLHLPLRSTIETLRLSPLRPSTYAPPEPSKPSSHAFFPSHTVAPHKLTHECRRRVLHPSIHQPAALFPSAPPHARNC